MKKIMLIFFLFSLIFGFSQEKPKENLLPKKLKKDLKVGLVLSGGGAKGFAHIGVLNILEELGVRIDYVGGTSAGAMIGAMYASGYRAKEIDSIIRSYDFNELIKDEIPRKLFSLYQKENSEKYALELPFKNWKIGLPIALSKGQNFLNELTKLTKHVHDIDDFKKLPIPFYCVATDIETGEKVILEKGFLPLAIKASGAFPTLFEPVNIDGKLLVDGGIVNNFPIDIMYKKEVDVIIGIDVQDKLGQRENLDSAPKIVMQIISFQMYDDADEQRNNTDIYMHPDVSEYSVFSFDKVDGLINEGEKIALKKREFLEAIVLQQIKKETNNLTSVLQKENKIHIEEIKIRGNENYTTDYVLSKLNIKGDSITYDQFNQSIKSLSATKNFKTINYHFTILPNKKRAIEFDLKENDIPNTIHLSAHYDDLYKTGILINYTSKHALINNDIFSLDIVLGDNLRYNIDYIINNGFSWEFGIKSRYNSFKRNFIIDRKNTASIFSNNQQLKYNEISNQVYFQSKFKEKAGLKIGAEHKNLTIFTENAITNRKDFFDNRNYFNLFSELILDTYDAKYFTKKGWYFNANYKLYFSASRFISQDFRTFPVNAFSQFRSNIGYTTTFFDKLTTQITSDIGLTIGTSEPVFDYFIGGNNENFTHNFVPFYGYDVAAISNSNFIKSTVTLRYELFTKNYISIIGNAAIAESTNTLNSSILTGYAVGYGIKSIIGPIELKYARTPDNNLDYWYFNIGFWF
ncbi:MAG: patatin-like phospholipase family protein [Flavobacteriaceae bacterium]|nr:patatin-like phospholipase family protein [Flavobacteriaceae bacterium]